MSKSRFEWKVGLFVLVGLLLLAGLMVQFSKGSSLFRPTYSILLRAGNVGGLKTRAAVLVSGVQVGSVSNIKLSPQGTNVTITLKIYKQYEIHKDARFVIEQSGFLGDNYIGIIPTRNEAPPFADLGIAYADPPLNLQEVARAASGFLQRLDETTGRLNSIVTNVSQLVLNETTLTNLAVTVANLRLVSEHAIATVDNLNRVIVTNGPALSESTSNLSSFSRRLNGVADGLNDVVATNSIAINSAVKNIESSTEVLKTLLTDVQAGKGVAGKVLQNEQLSATVSEIVNNLSVTSSNLNRLGVWGILWKKKDTAPRRAAAPSSHSIESPKGVSE